MARRQVRTESERAQKPQRRGGREAHRKPSLDPDVASPASPSRKRPLRLVALFAFLLAVLLVAWQQGILGSIPRTRAQQAIVVSDLTEADRWLGIAERLAPNDARNALLAARIARHRGDADAMQRQLTRAASLGADRQRIEIEETLALAQIGELESTESQIMDWLSEPGAEADEISDAYANGLATVGRFTQAMQVLQAWCADFPRDPRCEYRIGRIEEHREKYVDAEQHYRAAIDRHARFFPAIFSLGRVMLHQRRAEEAAEQFRKCLEMPNPVAAQIELAVAVKSLGRSEEARTLLKQALDAGSELQQASYRSVEEQPEGFRAAAEYGRLEADAGNFKVARPWLEAALRENPLDLTVRYSYALTLRGLGESAAAERQFERVQESRAAMGAANSLNERIKRDGTDLEARYLLGKLILENESERTGLYWIRSILAIDPDYAPAHALLAKYYTGLAKTDPRYRAMAEMHKRAAATASAPDGNLQNASGEASDTASPL